MIEMHFDGRLPKPFEKLDGLESLMEQVEALAGKVYTDIKHYRLRAAIGEGISLARATNKFFNDTAPWKLAKAGKTEELGGILYACCEALRVISVVLSPIMPGKMQELRAVLGLDEGSLSLDSAMTFFSLQPGSKIELGEALFPRIEEEKSSAVKPEKTKVAQEDNLLDISEFARAKLRVAEVIAAEPVEGADRLLKLQIDLGSERRQIVAGIAQHYSAEQMVGRRIIVVANLKPAKIRGVESNGMLLAAKSKDSLCIVTPDADLPAGSEVS
jgi:methionyl-tRNA synthetase